MTAKLTISDDSSNPPLNITARNSAPSAPASGDIYLDDGTNTETGGPNWRQYDGSGWSDVRGMTRVTQQTTDATATAPTGASVDIAEGEVIWVRAIVTGRIADLSAAIGGTVEGVFRRATGGNVTLVGSLTSTQQEDSAASPAFTLVADTSNQQVDVQVTGVASETWNWQIELEHRRY